MKLFAPRLLPCLVAISLLVLNGCKRNTYSQAATSQVKFTVENTLSSQPLILNSTVATTKTGETFTVSLFEYYLSNIKFKKADGTVYAAPDTYFLVNQAKPSSLSFAVAGVPVGDYSSVSFIVGVDAQKTSFTDPLDFTGDLNPANNMYWTWNSGHIFLKLEGMITLAGGTAKPLTCHIGGYAAPYNAIVTAAPSLQGAMLPVRADHSPEVHLRADLLRMFDGVTHVPLSTFPGAHMPSAAAVEVAHNYAAGMFRVQQVVAN